MAVLPPEAQAQLACRFQSQAHAAGDVLVAEGEHGDAAYLIAEGKAEVLVGGADIPIATLGEGDLFGELALLHEDRQRRATVRALTPVMLLRIAASDFDEVIAQHPQARAVLEMSRDTMEKARFLKLAATPFSHLDRAAFDRLLAGLQPMALEAGAILMCQGEPGQACYLVRAGRVEVLLQSPGRPERQIARLGPGAMIGEAALLTDAPRNATVRALETTELLALRREDVQAAIRSDHSVVRGLHQLLQMRSRPRRRGGIEMHERPTPSGDTLTILKDAARGCYFQLSPEGRFIWERLDGSATLRDLAVAYLQQFQAFAPQAIMDLIANLARAGFIEGVAALPDAPAAGATRLDGILSRARALLEWQVSIGKVDGWFTRAYAGGVQRLYTVAGQVFLALVAIAGLAAFALTSPRAASLLAEAGPLSLLILFPAGLLALLVHELGHAFTTKAFGREVRGVGIGWYWFGPIGFVDTSDMWLAGRWPRIAVSLAGPYAGLIAGSVAALAGTATEGIWALALWQVALAAYLSTLINLNPLLELDGYFILSDYLDHPNLRPRAMAWAGRALAQMLGGGKPVPVNWVYLAYAAGSLVFIVAMAYATIVAYRVLLQDWLAAAMPLGAAEAIGWLVAALFALLMSAGVLADLRRTAA